MTTQIHPGEDDFVIGAEPAGALAGGASFGASLRSLREARGWSLGDVSARLKFAPRQIEALEADRWDALPQGPSLRGLVRNYARLLDLDPDTLLRAIPLHLQHRPAAHAGQGATPSEFTPTALQRSGALRRRGPWLALVFWLFVVCVGALAVYLMFAWWLPRSADRPAGESAPGFVLPPTTGGGVPMASGTVVIPPGGSTATVDAPEAPAAPAEPVVPAPALTPPAPMSAVAPVGDGGGATSADALALPSNVPTGAPEGAIAGPNAVAESADEAVAESPPNTVALTVTSASWVEIRDAGGAVLLSATLQPGDDPEIEAAPPARVVVGNVGGVTLSWQGAPVDLAPHQRGNVARLTLE